MLHRKFLALLVVAVAAGCGAPPRHASWYRPVDEVQARLQHQEREAPSAEEYAVVRAEVAGEMNRALARYRDEAGSPWGTLRRLVGTVGAAVGLGATVSSFVVDDEDTQATLAQAGGSVAAVSGVFALLPLGSGAERARRLADFVEIELEMFEARWPVSMPAPPSIETWARFRADVEHLDRVVRRLAEE